MWYDIPISQALRKESLMTLDEAADIAFGIVDDYLLDGPEFQSVVEEV